MKRLSLITALILLTGFLAVLPVAAQEVTTTEVTETANTDSQVVTVTENEVVGQLDDSNGVIELETSPTPQPTPTPIEANSHLITISPPVRELELPRGSANSYQVTLTNQSQEAVTLVLRASAFTAAGTNGGVDVADDPLVDSQNWVVINPGTVTLDPGEQTDVTYTIVIPQDAEPGGFYFAIAALLAADSSVTGSSNQITTGSAVDLNVASLNLVTVEGDVNYSAQVSRFSTTKALFEYGPVPFTAQVLNTSTVHIKPILEVEVNNTWGLESPSLVHLESENILPQAQRDFQAEFSGKWHFGRYSATLNGLYGNGQTLTYTIFFWILPWKIIIAVILAIAIVVLLISSIRRQLKEKKILEAELEKIQGERKTSQGI